MENAYHMCGLVKSLPSSSVTFLGISDWIREKLSIRPGGKVRERDPTLNV